MRYKQEDATGDHIHDAIQTLVKSDRFEKDCRVKPNLETNLYWRKKKRIPRPFYLVSHTLWNKKGTSIIYCHFIVVVESLSHVRLCDYMDPRLPCPLLFPRVCSNSCPLSWSKGLSRVFSRTTIQRHQFFSLVLSLLYGPTLTSVPDYWKNHSFDYMALCWQSDVSAF